VQKNLDVKDGAIKSLETKMANKHYLEKVPQDVQEEDTLKLATYKEESDRLKKTLAMFEELTQK